MKINLFHIEKYVTNDDFKRSKIPNKGGDIPKSSAKKKFGIYDMVQLAI